MTNIFAISDLHLGFAHDKPMDVFGPAWEDHTKRIAASWHNKVDKNDIVLVAGDISWALKLENIEPDFAWLQNLPGKKIFVKGNHDYWWNSIGKIRKAASEDMFFIQNNAVTIDEVTVGGTRLWNYPEILWAPVPQSARNDSPTPEELGSGLKQPVNDEKIRQRELQRLRNSLQQLDKNATLRIAMTHYPPISGDGSPTPTTKIIEEFSIDICIYGHLHHLHLLNSEECTGADCTLNNTRYILTSCDWLDCDVKKIAEI